MPIYQSSRRPEIAAHELAHVTMILGCFDFITFNGYGEIVALMVVDLPVIGKVTISLYDREDHIKVYRGDDHDNNADDVKLWSGPYRDVDHNFEGKYDRDILIMHVKNVLRDTIMKELV